MDYISLKQQVEDAGLLKREYGYYAFKFFSSVALFALFAFFLFTSGSIWLQLLSVVGLAVMFMQFGFIGHDAGHHEVFNNDRFNSFLGQICFSLMVGLGYGYWNDKHNRHHANPNSEDEDPDFYDPDFALSEKLMSKRKGLHRFIAERQHILFVLITGTFLFAMQYRAFNYNVKGKMSLVDLAELSLMACHVALFWGLPHLFLPTWKAILLPLILRFVTGVYFGSIVASNHKGMKVVTEDEQEQLNFAEKQLLTTRNVRSGILIDFLYGGLNYQIEHHLFPTMSRNKLKESRPYVRKFCAENKLPYEETSVSRAFVLIFSELKAVALSCRKKRQVSTVKTLPVSQ